MKRIAMMLALAGTCAFGTMTASPAFALETYEAQMQATDAASQARIDMMDAFGPKELKPGQYVWRDVAASGPQRVVVSLSDQMAYLYKGDTMVAASTISSGEPGRDTPSGIFAIGTKKVMHHSRKYDNAPMPFAQFITDYGVALHAGKNPGYPASHGCVRLPSAFAKKLFNVTEAGTPVYIGA